MAAGEQRLFFTVVYIVTCILKDTSGCIDDAIEVVQAQSIYTVDLQFQNSLTIDCHHSCVQDVIINPHMTIQFAGSHDPYHSEPIYHALHRFKEKYSDIASKVSITTLNTSECQNGEQHFYLSLTDIRTTQLNNSVIHCWVVANPGYLIFYAKGISYIRILNTTVTPTPTPEAPTPSMSTTAMPEGPVSTTVTVGRPTPSTSAIATPQSSCEVTVSSQPSLAPSISIMQPTPTAVITVPNQPVSIAEAFSSMEVQVTLVGVAVGGAIAGVMLTIGVVMVVGTIKGKLARRNEYSLNGIENPIFNRAAAAIDPPPTE